MLYGMIREVKRTYNPCSRETQLQWDRYQHKQLKCCSINTTSKELAFFSVVKLINPGKQNIYHYSCFTHMMKGLENSNGTHQNSPSSEWVGCMEYFCCCFQSHRAATSVSSFMVYFVHVSLEYLRYFFLGDSYFTSSSFLPPSLIALFLNYLCS